MDLDEGVCAGCGKPLGIRANWRPGPAGRAYHNDCEPAPESEPREEPKETLGEHVERVARKIVHGPGAMTLDENDDG